MTLKSVVGSYTVQNITYSGKADPFQNIIELQLSILKLSENKYFLLKKKDIKFVFLVYYRQT